MTIGRPPPAFCGVLGIGADLIRPVLSRFPKWTGTDGSVYEGLHVGLDLSSGHVVVGNGIREAERVSIDGEEHGTDISVLLQNAREGTGGGACGHLRRLQRHPDELAVGRQADDDVALPLSLLTARDGVIGLSIIGDGVLSIARQRIAKLLDAEAALLCICR